MNHSNLCLTPIEVIQVKYLQAEPLALAELSPAQPPCYFEIPKNFMGERDSLANWVLCVRNVEASFFKRGN